MHPFLNFFSLFTRLNFAAQAQPNAVAPTPCRTYCNPLNLDYGHTPIPDFATAGWHRATTDPVITRYQGDYDLFSANQWGKLYRCIMVHSANDYTFKGMDQDRPYYFAIEAVNENGVSARTPVTLAK